MYRRIRVESVLSKSGLYDLDYAYNPYVGCSHGCAYCYARAYTRHTEVARNWGRVVYVKENAVEVLRREVRVARKGVVGVSTLTDPYQPVEEVEELTRRGLEVLLGEGFRVSVQTKSPLVVRDLDVLEKYAGLVDVGFTVTTLDPETARLVEPGAPPPASRVGALRKVSEAGVETWVFVGPIMRGVNDSAENLRKIVETAGRVGAKVFYDFFHFKPALDESMSPVLEKHPDATSTDPRWRALVERVLLEACRDEGVECRPAFPKKSTSRQSRLTSFLD